MEPIKPEEQVQKKMRNVFPYSRKLGTLSPKEYANFYTQLNLFMPEDVVQELPGILDNLISHHAYPAHNLEEMVIYFLDVMGMDESHEDPEFKALIEQFNQSELVPAELKDKLNALLSNELAFPSDPIRDASQYASLCDSREVSFSKIDQNQAGIIHDWLVLAKGWDIFQSKIEQESIERAILYWKLRATK